MTPDTQLTTCVGSSNVRFLVPEFKEKFAGMETRPSTEKIIVASKAPLSIRNAIAISCNCSGQLGDTLAILKDGCGLCHSRITSNPNHLLSLRHPYPPSD